MANRLSGGEKLVGGEEVLLLSVAFEAYKRDVIVFRNQYRKTEEHHTVTLKSLITFLGKDIEVSLLTFAHVRDWKIHMEKAHRTQATIRGYLVRLRVVLAYLKANGYNSLDSELITLPKRVQSVPEVITPAEVQLLIDSTDKIRNKAIISLLYSTGLRVSELCSLDRSDVRENHFTVLGKGGKSRICFIDERTRELIDAYLAKRVDNNPALFIDALNGSRIKPGGVQEIFRRVRAKAGFSYPIHPHTMRHSYATNLMSNGMHIYTLSRLLGHASIQTTAIYLHISDPKLEEEYIRYHSI